MQPWQPTTPEPVGGQSQSCEDVNRLTSNPMETAYDQQDDRTAPEQYPALPRRPQIHPGPNLRTTRPSPLVVDQIPATRGTGPLRLGTRGSRDRPWDPRPSVLPDPRRTTGRGQIQPVPPVHA